MTIHGTGTPIKSSEMNAEFFGNNNERGISNFYGLGTLPSSGQIAFSQFYGQSATAASFNFIFYLYENANYGNQLYSFTSLGSYIVASYISGKAGGWTSTLSSWNVVYDAGISGRLKVSYWTTPGNVFPFPSNTSPTGVFTPPNVDNMSFLGNYGLDNSICKIRIEVV